jgi:hypothetical protein
MRRTIYVGTWFAACFFLWTATFAAEQVTLTTYYPSPVGDYQVVTAGKLNIDLSGTDDAAGTGLIQAGNVSSSPISTNRVTANSLIFLTIGASTNNNPGIRVESISAGNDFTVRRLDSADTANAINFYWLVVN